MASAHWGGGFNVQPKPFPFALSIRSAEKMAAFPVRSKIRSMSPCSRNIRGQVHISFTSVLKVLLCYAVCRKAVAIGSSARRPRPSYLVSLPVRS